MLRYDARWLMEQYAGETPVHPGVPYMWLGGPGPYEVRRAEGEFRLTEVTRVRPSLAHDDTVVRLANYESGRLWVQPCAYSDGVKSNYAMDGTGELRDLLSAEYGKRLPPFTDARLSNAIGTAVVVFDGEGAPYLPRRAAGQSVFPGGYHCTASGETLWRPGRLTFDGLFTASVYGELEEEVGLLPEDLEWVRPLGLCREFLRGGKPQFFFAGKTSLGAGELALRRRAAMARQIAAGRQEVMDEVATDVAMEACTLECRANLLLAGWAARVSP